MSFLNRPLCIHGGAIDDCDSCGKDQEKAESTYRAQEMALSNLRSRLSLAEAVFEAAISRMKKDGFCPLCAEEYNATWDSCDHHESCLLRARDAGKEGG